MGKAKVFYDPSTDSMSINLVDRPAADNEEIAENVIVGYDKDNNVVLIEFMGGVRDLFAPLIHARSVGRTAKGTDAQSKATS